MDRPPPPQEPEADPLIPVDGEWRRYVTLRDGTQALMRQIRPDDRHRLAQGMQLLSPASRYLRFHEPLEELSDTQLDYLTQVDHQDHEAIVALDLDRPDVPGIGVARYIRDEEEPHVAEAAVTVADDYQGTGAGTLLLGALARHARRNDIEVFRNYVLDGNHAMLKVFDDLGASRNLQPDGLWQVDLAIPDDESDVPASPGAQAFSAVARGQRGIKRLITSLRGQRAARQATSQHYRDTPTDTTSDSRELRQLHELRRSLEGWLQQRRGR